MNPTLFPAEWSTYRPTTSLRSLSAARVRRRLPHKPRVFYFHGIPHLRSSSFWTLSSRGFFMKLRHTAGPVIPKPSSLVLSFNIQVAPIHLSPLCLCLVQVLLTKARFQFRSREVGGIVSGTSASLLPGSSFHGHFLGHISPLYLVVEETFCVPRHTARSEKTFGGVSSPSAHLGAEVPSKHTAMHTNASKYW